MTSYEFGGSLYRNVSEMCAAIADSYLCAGGANDRADMLQTLSEMSDEKMADEAIREWGLDRTLDDDPDDTRTWLERRDADRDDIVAAFADLREHFDERYPPYNGQYAAWLGDKVIIIPDEVFHRQREWVGKPFDALDADLNKIRVELDPDAYGLFTSGTGDVTCKLVEENP